MNDLTTDRTTDDQRSWTSTGKEHPARATVTPETHRCETLIGLESRRFTHAMRSQVDTNTGENRREVARVLEQLADDLSLDFGIACELALDYRDASLFVDANQVGTR